ncbi:VOC family protein [Actinoplanes sp. CA-051413]|uniref:VOC family protein n=1 Tax=Actinoplanes sp. CA-051413 TaxID=3239899 RepID=UPI003D96E405
MRTPDTKTGWNRVHLDVRPYPGDDTAAEAARLRALGATAVGVDPAEVHWTVLTDREGKEFCLLAPA